MSSDHHSDPKFTEKGKPKGEIKYNISLNEEQKDCKRTILSNKITFVKGKAGSGKSLISVIVGLDLLFKKEVDKIIITRPMVTSGEEWGFLPGGINEKISPFTAPMFDNMYRCSGKEKIDKLVEEGKIEVVPFAFMRGRNFSRTFVIGDELQNATFEQLKMLLTRMCQGSKVVLNGDPTQIDLPKKSDSGFDPFCKHLKGIKNIEIFSLKENHRDPIVEDILQVLDNL